MKKKKLKKKGGRREGAGRPAMSDDEKRARVSYTLPRDVVANVHRVAEEEGVSNSSLVERIFNEWWKRWQRKR